MPWKLVPICQGMCATNRGGASTSCASKTSTSVVCFFALSLGFMFTARNDRDAGARGGRSRRRRAALPKDKGERSYTTTQTRGVTYTPRYWLEYAIATRYGFPSRRWWGHAFHLSHSRLWQGGARGRYQQRLLLAPPKVSGNTP